MRAAAPVLLGVILSITGTRDANGTEPEAIHSAILDIKDCLSAEGEYGFDVNGDELHGYNVVRNDGGTLAYVRRVDFLTE